MLWIGGDPYVLDVYGLTPLDTAEQYRHHDITVGLRAVSKREKVLAGNLNSYDEVIRLPWLSLSLSLDISVYGCVAYICLCFSLFFYVCMFHIYTWCF